MEHGAKVAQYLQGLDFPATKQECLDYAQQRNAPDDVIEALDHLPERQYFSIANIWDLMEPEE